jgi:CheY-like chemotaxis protein
MPFLLPLERPMGRPGILIVDREVKALSVLESGLKQEGFDVRTSASGEDALRTLGETGAEAPAMVLADVDSSGLDGFELCRRVRGLASVRGVPFVLLSRREAASHRDRAREAGADDYLVKPLFLKDVCTLGKLYAGRQAPDQAIGGDLSITSLFHVLRALTSGGRSGTLELFRAGGALQFRDGVVVHAAVDHLTGEAALSRLLLLSSGPFAVRFGPVAREGKLSFSLRDLVLRGQPKVRRFEATLATLGGLDVRLALNFQALSRELARLPDSLNGFVRLFDGQRSIGRVLRETTLEADTALEVARRLVDLQILSDRREEPAAKASHLPALFEPRPDAAVLAMSSLFPEPLPASALPESAPSDVCDWFSDYAPRDTFKDILAADDGGWREMTMEQACKEALVLSPAPSEGVGAALERELSKPAGASAVAVPSWSFEAPGLPTQEGPRSRSHAAAATPITPTSDGTLRLTEAHVAAPAPVIPLTEAHVAAPAPVIALTEAHVPRVGITLSTVPLPIRSAASQAGPPVRESVPGRPASLAPAGAPGAARGNAVQGSPNRVDRKLASGPQEAPPAATPAAVVHFPRPFGDAAEDAFFQSEPSADAIVIDGKASAPKRGLMAAVVAVGVFGCAVTVAALPLRFEHGTPAALPTAPSMMAESLSVNARPFVASELLPVPELLPLPVEEARPTTPTPKDVPDPGPAEALLARGRSLYDAGNPAAALAPLEAAARLAPARSDVKVLLALAQFDTGALELAERTAMRALYLVPPHPDAQLVLGMVYQQQGQPQKARVEYEAYLALAPSGKHAGEVRAILSSLR